VSRPRPEVAWSRFDRLAAPIGVFLILWGSYAFFWQARDWNSASRLMLTYALVDRGTIALDGLQDQTRDIAWFDGHYHTDKQPGYSLLATVPYATAKWLFGLPDHPLEEPGFRRWAGDYWTTWGTSGFAGALTGALLVVLAGRLGCGPRPSALVGLLYGLTTPAYAYSTMSYGHQVAACCLFGSMLLIATAERRPRTRLAAAGFLAAWASVVELSVGPVSALLGGFAIGKAFGASRPRASIAAFAVGAALPTSILVGYNVAAFGSPWEVGYFHHANPEFAQVHSEENPLGLGLPDWSKAKPLLWGGHRGLLFYAPVLITAPVGFGMLARKRVDGILLVSIGACLAVFLVNLSYPEWTGGWSTGPRLLVPLLPFAMVGVAGFLRTTGRVGIVIGAGLGLAGALLMLLFLGVGAQLPQDLEDPLLDLVWPLWSGAPVPPWWPGARFTTTLCALIAPDLVDELPPGRSWLQFVPLVIAQILIFALLMMILGRSGRDRPRHPSNGGQA